MTRSQLIDAVAGRLGIERNTAEAVVRVVFDTMGIQLTHGGPIELRGFGSFGVRDHGPYLGRNPRSGQPVEVSPRRSVVFRVGKALRARVEAQSGAPLVGGGDDDEDLDREDVDEATALLRAARGPSRLPPSRTHHE